MRPDLRVAEKEALLRREAIDVRRPRFSLHRFLKRRVSNRQPAKISNALAGYELAFLMQARLHFVAVELIDDALRARLELRQVFACPPILEVPFWIELGSAVVKAVRHLVANHHANGAVIDRIVGLWIKEWPLQDACRKNDFVHRWIVVSIHGRRRHSPLGAINRFADLFHLPIDFEHVPAHYVLGVRRPIDLQV